MVFVGHKSSQNKLRIKKWLMPEGSLDILRQGNLDYAVRFTEDVTGAEVYTN